MRRVSRAVLLGTASLALSAAAFPALRGGWAVLTLHELPSSLAVGRATTLQFSLRQHGEELLAGRAPVLHVRSGAVLLGEHQEIPAERTRERGVYRATFTPTEAGEVRLSVDADYHGWVSKLLPITAEERGPTASSTASSTTVTTAARNSATNARASASQSTAQSTEQRGRALFVAKGCIGCHTKADDAALNDFREMRIGPDLGGRSFPAQWLVQKILDPASLRPADPRAMNLMPQLEVSAAEAQAIAAYLNARAVALR